MAWVAKSIAPGHFIGCRYRDIDQRQIAEGREGRADADDGLLTCGGRRGKPPPSFAMAGRRITGDKKCHLASKVFEAAQRKTRLSTQASRVPRRPQASWTRERGSEKEMAFCSSVGEDFDQNLVRNLKWPTLDWPLLDDDRVKAVTVGNASGARLRSAAITPDRANRIIEGKDSRKRLAILRAAVQQRHRLSGDAQLTGRTRSHRSVSRSCG